MRDAFFEELHTLFCKDERVVFLTGDLGYKLFAPLLETDPTRVVNVGIREAAMVGFAAGLAKMGRLPFVYSIVPFLTLRCLEQIKLDLCYNQLRVVLVGVGGGFAYGPNGPTHHGVDDIGVLSTLPNLHCWTPATPREVRSFVEHAPELDSSSYLRLGRNGEVDLELPTGKPGGPVLVCEGEDGTIVSYGTILHEVLKAVELLKQEGLRPRVLHLPSLHPDVEATLLHLLSDGRPCMTVEEHVAAGGLGQRLGATLARNGRGVPFEALSIPDRFPDACYRHAAALAWAGIDAGSIAKRYRDFVNA